MAKYDIVYGCGCTVTKQLTGKLQDRDSYIAWAATQDCPECKKAKFNEECRIKAENSNFPTLTGSEKQVTWAVAIRQAFLDNLDMMIKERLPKVNDSNRERAMATLQTIYNIRDAIIANETSAKWWIDKRYDMPQGIIADYREIMKL